MPKTQSIKKDLIITLSILIAAVLILVRVAGFVYVRHHNQEVLDANLVKSAKLIFSLVKHDVFEGQDLKFLTDTKPAFQQKIYHRYEYKLHAQAWEENELIYNSDNFLLTDKPDYDGFKDILIDGQTWRSFSFYDSKSKIRIHVAEKDFVTNQMIWEIILSFVLPLLFSFSLLFVIVIVTVNRKLKPFYQLASEIEKMSASTLQQFKNHNLPIELKPFIESFNSLVRRLVDAINSERNFTNYAAHELKTPLSAISVQAHLLVNNKNKEKEKEYVQDLLSGINRATHLINQLLTLSRLESDGINIKKEQINLAELTEIIAKNYATKAKEKNLEIEFEYFDGDKNLCPLSLRDTETRHESHPALRGSRMSMGHTENLLIEGSKIYIEIIISNLLDNAIKYSKRDGKVAVSISRKSDSVSLKITNSGDQIFPEEIEKIFGNFYRVNRLESKNPNVGCGLGF